MRDLGAATDRDCGGWVLLSPRTWPPGGVASLSDSFVLFPSCTARVPCPCPMWWTMHAATRLNLDLIIYSVPVAETSKG